MWKKFSQQSCKNRVRIYADKLTAHSPQTGLLLYTPCKLRLTAYNYNCLHSKTLNMFYYTLLNWTWSQNKYILHIFKLVIQHSYSYVVSELILDYVFHCNYFIIVFVYLLVNQLRFQFWKRLISHIIKPIVNSKHF